MTNQFVDKKEFDKFKLESQESTSAILDAIKGISSQSVDNSAKIASTPEKLNTSTTVYVEPPRVYSVTGLKEPEKPQTVEQASAQLSNYTLNPAHQGIFNEYFDPADGFEGRLDYPYFSIIVPMKFSNADAAWKAYYKVDTRMKFLKHDDIEGGIRGWCKLVAGNLKYNKSIQTK